MWGMFRDFDGQLAQRFIAELATKGGALFVAFLLARMLDSDGFGGYSQIQAFVMFLVPIVLLGLGFAIIRQIAGFSAGEDTGPPLLTAFAIVSALAMALGLAMWLASGPIAETLSDHPSAPQLVRWAAVLLPVSAWQALIFEALRARQRVRSATLLQVGEAVLLLSGIGVLATLHKLSPTSAIAVFTLVKFLILLCAGFDFIRSQRIGRGQLSILPPDKIRPALAMGIPFMIAGLGDALMGAADRVLVGSLADADTVGRYVAAYMLAAVLASLGAPHWWLLYPRLAQALARSSHDDAIAVTQHLFGKFLTWAIPLAIVLAFAGPWLLTQAIGPGFLVSSATMGALVLAVFVNQAATPWEYSLYAQGRSVFLMWVTLAWGLLAIAGIAALLPWAGLAGAAAAVAIARIGFAVTVGLRAARSGFGSALFPSGVSLRIAGGMAAGFIVTGAVSILLDGGQKPHVYAAVFSATYIGTVLGVAAVQARRHAA